MDFLADIATSPKKIGAFIVFLIGGGLLLRAIGDAQNPQYPRNRLLLLLVVGFALGTAGALYLYWLRAAQRKTQDAETVAIETLAKHGELMREAQLQAHTEKKPHEPGPSA